MKKLTSFIRVITFGAAIFWGTAAVAQTPEESIFIPAADVAPNHADDAEVSNSLAKLISLHRDMYRLIMTFDARAKQVERFQPRYERGQMEKREFQLKYPDTPYEPEEVYGGYSVLVQEPTMCAQLDETLKRFIAKNGDALSHAVSDLTKQTKTMSDAEKAVEAEKYRVAMAAIPEVRRAQEILYLCLYKYKNENGIPTAYSVEKTMRSWFVIETPLIDAWIGNVD